MEIGQALRKRRILGISKLRLHDYINGYLFIAPALLGILIFGVVPLVYALYISFHDYHILKPQMQYVGLKNYNALLEDSVFRKSIVNTSYYALLQVSLQTIVALGLALLIQRKVKGLALFRAAFYLPVVISVVVASTLWRIIYASEGGLLNSILLSLGLPRQPLLLSTTQAIPALAIMMTWKWVGFSMLIFLAGLQAIPEDYYEAAQMDGASGWRSFLHITLPLLRRPGLYVVATSTINAYKLFTPIYVITQGGPEQSTTTTIFYIFRTAFRWYNMGSASAMAFVFLLILVVLTAFQFTIFRSEVEY
ncbi:MAG: sugar ABC transporter permease [Chloroflexi bacterium]|nr:sugar ABC transporter permease [Chloroflexota bacterium]